MKRLFIKYWKPMLLVLIVQVLVNLILMGGEILTKKLVDAALASSLEHLLPLAMIRLLFVVVEIISGIVYQIAEAKCTTSILKKLRENYTAAYSNISFIVQANVEWVYNRYYDNLSFTFTPAA